MAKLKVDFTGVEDGFTLIPEGEYICKVKSIELKDGTKGKTLKWTLVIGTGPQKGKQIFHNTSLVPAALFNLRNTIMACGYEVPKSLSVIDTDLYLNKILGVVVGHKEYEKDGQKKKGTQVNETFQVVKTDKGYVRAAQAAVTKLTEAPSKKDEDEPEEVETSSAINMEDDDEMDI